MFIFKLMWHIKLVTLLIVLHFGSCFSQINLNYEQKEIWFDLAVGRENTGLVNGPEYFIPFQGFNTNPFFGSLEATNETLRLDEKNYYNVSLLYDTYSNVLVLRIKDKSNLFTMVQLDKERVQSFTLQGHLFQKMTNPLLQGETKQGFYDLLYKGINLSLLCKRAKTDFVEEGQRKYKVKDKYYLIYENRWSGLSGFKDFYELRGTRKKDVTSFMKGQKIKARKMMEKDLVAVASFCNSGLENFPKE
jgi:hypothetical protein